MNHMRLGIVGLAFAISASITAPLAAQTFQENQAKQRELQKYEVDTLNRHAQGKNVIADNANALKKTIDDALAACRLVLPGGDEKPCTDALGRAFEEKTNFETLLAGFPAVGGAISVSPGMQKAAPGQKQGLKAKVSSFFSRKKPSR